MSQISDRVATFLQKAKEGPVTVSIYSLERAEGNEAIKPGSLLNKFIIYASLIASGIGLSNSINNAQIANSQRAQKIEQTAAQNLQEENSGEMSTEVAPEKKYNQVEVVYQGRKVMTLDIASRIALTKEAAEKAGLTKVGLNWKDLYGVIHAETAWISRDGKGKNGVTSVGLAQMEPATAKALGIKNSNDPVDAVGGAARLLVEAAIWSQKRVAGMGISARDKPAMIREGVSVFYNTSSHRRRHWHGHRSDLPMETNNHIKNTRVGVILAGNLERTMLGDTNAQVETASIKLPESKLQPIKLGTSPMESLKAQQRANTNDHHVAAHQGSEVRQNFERVRPRT